MPRTRLTSSRTALVALGAVTAAVAVGALVDVQAGVLALAAIAVVGAVTRLTLPAGKAFSVRRRYVDVSVLSAFAVALTFLALSTPLS
ncbi:DUF3017 domain-containing protein [Demequina muriae]|uniref:DUF3017 domain-containing protein n=1 Tax=Demequina muriae TaxID=3051664 RepID=A0ABT8GHN4_9MICO|nr:DUF3017 domain-containing protein [Demequina sp. EGI L300058]MDN4480935.1 DUF3017 domain-containing protein [Demequina sp. EGI L300058]